MFFFRTFLLLRRRSALSITLRPTHIIGSPSMVRKSVFPGLINGFVVSSFSCKQSNMKSESVHLSTKSPPSHIKNRLIFNVKIHLTCALSEEHRYIIKISVLSALKSVITKRIAEYKIIKKYDMT